MRLVFVLSFGFTSKSLKVLVPGFDCLILMSCLVLQQRVAVCLGRAGFEADQPKLLRPQGGEAHPNVQAPDLAWLHHDHPAAGEPAPRLCRDREQDPKVDI